MNRKGLDKTKRIMKLVANGMTLAQATKTVGLSKKSYYRHRKDMIEVIKLVVKRSVIEA